MSEPHRPAEGPGARCADVTDVGPYVLGALPARERTAFESHLRACPECRRAVDELAALPGWLDLVPPEVVGSLVEASGLGLGPGPDAEGPAIGGVPERLADDLRVDPGPPPALLRDLLRVAQRDEGRARRRRAWVGSVAAAAVVALTVLVSAGTLRPPWLEPADPSAPTVEARAIELTPVGDSPVSASVRLESVAWGTRIDLTCEYDAGASGAESATSGPSHATDGAAAGGPYANPVARYALVVRDAQGRTEEVATWAGVVGAPMRVPASTVMPRAEIVEVELRGSDGVTLLRADT